MKYLPGMVTIAAVMLTAGAALAGEQTVRLNVANMTCISCPYIVKRSLEDVDGVPEAAVSYEEHQATVRFDDGKTATAALTQATAGYGFPSTVIE